MKLFAKSAMLLMLAALSTIFVSAQSEINSAKKAKKVFSDKSLELEIKKLRQMKAADKIKVRKAIEDLEAAS